jgi:hypothetical protein
MDLLDRAQPRTEAYLQIAADGVGPLTAETPANAAEIGKLMPGYTTGTILIGLEAETANAIVVFKSPVAGATGGDVQVLDIVGAANGKIREIHAVNQHVMGPGGETPGMTVEQTGTDIASCRAGTGLWLGMAVCPSAAAANVRLLFALKGDTATAGHLPPKPELERGELQRIIWTPKA